MITDGDLHDCGLQLIQIDQQDPPNIQGKAHRINNATQSKSDAQMSTHLIKIDQA